VDADGVRQPKAIPIRDSAGNQVYVVPSTTDDDGNALYPNAGLTTLCSSGYSATGLTGCTGDSPNSAAANTVAPFEERFLGNSAKPRVSVGIGVNWNSPFGPFRIDVAKALIKEPGDDTKLFTFNVGTQF
jgi:outer membrane protein insertion porin family